MFWQKNFFHEAGEVQSEAEAVVNIDENLKRKQY